MLEGGTRSRRTGARALLISLILHGLLVLVVIRTVPQTPWPPQTRILEIELRQEEPAVAPEAATPTLIGPPAPRQRLAQPESRERHVSRPARAEPAPSPAPPAEPTSPLRMRPPKLTLDSATLDRFSREGVISAPPAVSAPPGSGKSKWQQKLAMVERDGAGRKNVEEGKVHPQIFDFMRDAEEVFAPRESVVKKDDRAPTTVGRSVKSWTRGFFRNYLDRLRQLEKEEPSRKGALSEGGSDVLAEYGRLLRAAEKGAESITCQVCLVIRPGLPPEVVLAKSSGNKEVDEAATLALTRAAARRTLEEDLRPQRACYRFAAVIYRIPPLPIVGCNFDESTLKFGCYYPGKLIYQLKVSLDLVDYSDG